MIRQKGARMNKRFWNWKNDGGGRQLYLYGTIAEESWADDDITPEMFRKELMAGDGPITIWLSSPGGDCVAASQIYTMLMEYTGPATVKIDGVAASAASVIAMAGTQVLMAPTALMMLHNPATIAFGDHNDMAKAIDLLEAVKESIITAYEINTGLDRKTLAEFMESETWLDCNKAIELGFADGMLEKVSAPVQNSSVLFSQRKVDAALVNKLVENMGIPVQPLYDRLNKLCPNAEDNRTEPKSTSNR